jgi:hypothetical protein
MHDTAGSNPKLSDRKFGRPGVIEVTSRRGITIRNGGRAESDRSGEASASAASGLAGALACRTAKIDMTAGLPTPGCARAAFVTRSSDRVR